MTALGVKSTGIYCRAGCPSRTPLERNQVRFRLAASAEAAGYRACHRCRPYRAPQTLDWAAPELVCRAVGLILDGALDRSTESELGARLGISARHLRRLFDVHLGVTPDGLARSARAHFARRLLDDTDLSVLEVALAAGYGSVRQFNRACRQIFHSSPTELRARRRRGDPLAAEEGLRLRLPVAGPLDWPALTAYLAERAIRGVERVEATTYRRTILVGDSPGAIELVSADEGHLELRVRASEWGELLHVAQRARHIASLDNDHEASLRHLAADAVIGPLVRARPGLRVPGTWDAFETGVAALVGDGLTTAEANALMGRLVERVGTPVVGLENLGLSALFPSATVLAAADLTHLGLPAARIAAVRAFAEAVAADRIRLDRSVELEQLVSSLAAVPGLSTSTAQYIALRIGERDAYGPVQETHRTRTRPTGRSLVDVAERWRPWRALAFMHLTAAGSDLRLAENI